MADERDDGERPLWVLTTDEKRLLFITFVGGLASIIVGAGMIGLAIAYARSQLTTSKGNGLADAVGMTAFLIVLYFMMVRRERMTGWLRWTLTGLTGFVVALTILWLVGVAAGIH